MAITSDLTRKAAGMFYDNSKELERITELEEQYAAAQRALDGEREKVKELEADLAAEEEAVANMEKAQAEERTWLEQTNKINDGLIDELSQLQALVWALPVVTGKLEVDCGACYYVRALDGKENPVVCGLMTEQTTAFAIKALLAYRATLDATTTAAKGGDGE